MSDRLWDLLDIIVIVAAIATLFVVGWLWVFG